MNFYSLKFLPKIGESAKHNSFDAWLQHVALVYTVSSLININMVIQKKHLIFKPQIRYAEHIKYE